MIIIDAKDAIVGRFATVAAKRALLGEQIAIINCEKAILTGDKKYIVADWKDHFHRGVPRKGPFVVRLPDRMVRRMIRGMLPYKTPRGIAAFRRIMCYVGEPTLTGEKIVIEGAKVDKLPTMKFITVGALSKQLGGKDGQE